MLHPSISKSAAVPRTEEEQEEQQQQEDDVAAVMAVKDVAEDEDEE